MSVFVDILSWVCIVLGAAFTLIGCLGLWRFPDVFSRMHAGGVAETLGVLFLFLGMGIQAFVILPETKMALLVAGKLAMIAIFYFIQTRRPPMRWRKLHYGEELILRQVNKRKGRASHRKHNFLCSSNFHGCQCASIGLVSQPFCRCNALWQL